MNDRPLSAYAVANVVGMLVSYRGSRSWAFRHREVVGPAGGRPAYFVINTVTMAVPLLCLAVSRYLLDLDSALATTWRPTWSGSSSAPGPGSSCSGGSSS